MKEYEHRCNIGIEEQELFQRIKENDNQAFATVYERYHKMLYTLSVRLLKDTDAAEDVVQYVFVKLWELRGELSISINLRNYLYTMAKNYILNYIRHNSRTVVHNYIMSQSEPLQDDSLANTIERLDITQKLQSAITKLPPQQRVVLTLKHKGYSNKEIAEQMSLSVNTVKTHYADGLRQLKLAFGTIIKIFIIILCL